MKILYYLSFVLSAPFVALTYVLCFVAFCVCWIGDTIHDNTTLRIWMAIHKRRIKS